MIRYILLMGIFSYVLPGCNPAAKSPDKLIDWVEDKKNGLLVNKTTDNINYALQYEPALYKLLRTEGYMPDSENQDDLNTEKYDGLHYFSLKIEPKNHVRNNDTIEAYLRTHYKKYLRFITGNDTIEGADMFHIESSGIKPYYHVLLAYPKTGKVNNLLLQILSNPLHEESLKFSFSEEALKKVREFNLK